MGRKTFTQSVSPDGRRNGRVHAAPPQSSATACASKTFSGSAQSLGPSYGELTEKVNASRCYWCVDATNLRGRYAFGLQALIILHWYCPDNSGRPLSEDCMTALSISLGSMMRPSERFPLADLVLWLETKWHLCWNVALMILICNPGKNDCQRQRSSDCTNVPEHIYETTEFGTNYYISFKGIYLIKAKGPEGHLHCNTVTEHK